MDRFGNLFVSDNSLEYGGNNRLLVFDTSLIPTNNASSIFAPAASKIFPNIAPWQPAFDSQNRMFVGYNGLDRPEHRFISVYNNPLGSSTTPDAFLNDFFSHPFSLTFDSNNNLYAADLNRNRVLIYKRPYSAQQISSLPVASPSLPLPSTSPTPSPVAASPASGDTQAPSVALSEPANGVNVAGTVKIVAAASDNAQVIKMQVLVDDAVVASADNSTTIFYNWNTRPKKISVGLHSIKVTAYDSAGNLGSAAVTVTKVK